MISKEQAEIISEQIIQDAKLSPNRPDKLFRHVGPVDKTATAMLLAAVLLLYRVPAYFCFALMTCASVLYLIALHQSRQPIFEISNHALIYRGFLPWNRRVFELQEIIKVTLFIKTNFFANVKMLCVQTDTDTLRIWLMWGVRFDGRQMNHFFRTNFRQRFINFAD